MTVLVTGATGSIGGAVTRALLARGADVRALVRDAGRIPHLPAGTVAVSGDLGAALVGVRAALYVSPHHPDELRLAETFARTCQDRGVRVVFAGVYLGGRTAASRWLLRTALGLALPHYRGKLRIAHLMSRAGTDPVVFGLPNYYQNDEIVRDDILAGGYPLPVHDKGVNRIDLRDAAEVVARALTEPAFPSGGHVLSGPASISGAGAARVWSDVLGRPVRYDGTGDWRAVLTRRLDGQKRDDFLHTYALLAKRGMATSARSVAATTALLGRPPRSYESYVRDTADLWQAAPRA